MATEFHHLNQQHLSQAIDLAIQVSDMKDPIVSNGDVWVSAGKLASSYNINDKTTHESLIVSACLEHAMTAEKAGAGALRAVLQLARLELLGQGLSPSTNQSVRPTRRHLEGSLIDFCGADAGVVAKTFLDASKGLSRVSIQEGRSDLREIYISQTNGHIFHPSQFGPTDATLSNCKLLCYDGHIQDVSQLDNQLQAAAATGFPFLVCARSFGDDIKNTAAVNFSRGTMKLLLCEFPLENEFVNTFYDMATITGCHVVDLQAGLSLPSIKFEDFVVLDKIEISKFGLVIFSNGSQHRTKFKVDELQGKADLAKDEEAKIYKKRIATLSPSRWDVLVPGGSRNSAMKQNLDRAFKMVLGYRSSGAVKLTDAERNVFGGKVVPAQTYKAAFEMSAALCKHLRSIAGTITAVTP